MQTRLAAEQAALARGKNQTDIGTWQLIGPSTLNEYGQVDSGRISAIAVDPTNNQIVYAGAAQGGIWKTTDGGGAWTPLTDTQASLAIGSIAIDPQNHLTIYVGTGEDNNSIDSYYGEGILKSTDGGNTWTNIPGPFAGGEGGGARIGGLAVQPNNASVVLAAVGCCAPGPSGVYRSANGGQTWTQVLNAGYAEAYNVIFDPHTPNTAYASLDANGVYKSTNAGVTWAAANGAGASALPLSGNGRVALAMDPNTTTTLWAAIASNTNSNLAGLFKTTDGGNTWTNLPDTPSFCGTQCWYDLALAVQPGNSNVIFAGGQATYAPPSGGSVVQSLDGGDTWTIYDNLHPDTHALAFSQDGSILYVGNDGGMFSTNQVASTKINWTDLNAGLATEQFYPGLSVDPNNVNIAFGGTQDNSMEAYYGTTAWTSVACGDGGVTLIDNTTSPDTVYTNCIELSVLKSTDGGQTFQSAQNGINTSDRVNWTPPAAMDPTNLKRLYFGTQHVYQTTNGAGLWTQISPDLTNGDTLSAIAVSPVNPGTVWAASTDSRVSLTLNALNGATASWSNVTGTNMLPPRYITALAADPHQADTAYVTFSGFTGYGDNLGHVFITTNSGASWTDISGNLPNLPVDDIVVDPEQANTIYVATDFGVFYTTNGGAAWATLVTGLPRVAVLSLKLHPSRNLFAATHGRSMWETNVSSVTSVPSIVGLSPSSVIAGAATFTLTVNGGAFTNTAIVQWNGADLATKFVSATQITATVPAADVTTGGTAEITVIIPGGGVSNAFQFAILSSQLSITKSHSGNFTQGQDGPVYSVTVTNAGPGPTGGTVTVTDTAPAGMTLVSMADSGTGAPTWTCTGNACTTGNALAVGASYPAINVTVNVAVNAPGQVTNQVSASGGGPGKATASDLTIIEPLVANDIMSGTTPAGGSGCAVPPPSDAFLTASSQAEVWFLVSYANAGDQAVANWYAPNGSLYTSASWAPVSSAGSFCFWDSIDIAGNMPASEPGNWSVTLNWNGSLLFELQFTIGSTLNVPSDFNHDGQPDVIWEEPKVGWAQTWYLGGPQGVSITNAANLTKANPWQIVGIGDFNGDGNPDVAWQDPVHGAVQVWYLGGPLGNQLIGAADITASNPWRVVSVADFNGDGHPDLLWQNPTNGFSQIWYLGGPQGITLLGAADLDQTNPWRIVGTGDFNGDGVPDVLWQDPVSGTVQIWYMGGNTPGAQGTQLISAVNLTGKMTTKVVAIADFNQDGHPDVIFQDPVTGAATVYYFTGAQGAISNGTAVLSSGNSWYIAGPH